MYISIHSCSVSLFFSLSLSEYWLLFVLRTIENWLFFKKKIWKFFFFCFKRKSGQKRKTGCQEINSSDTVNYFFFFRKSIEPKDKFTRHIKSNRVRYNTYVFIEWFHVHRCILILLSIFFLIISHETETNFETNLQCWNRLHTLIFEILSLLCVFFSRLKQVLHLIFWYRRKLKSITSPDGSKSGVGNHLIYCW